MKWLLISAAISIPTTWQKSVKMKYQAPEIEWKTEQETEADGFCSYEANTATHKYRIYYSDVMKSWMCTYYRFSKPETKHKYLPTAQELKEWVETTHYPSALRKAGFKPVDKEVLKPTVYRLDYFDGEYSGDLVHSYDRSELEKLIADATEYHKTIKDLDFDDDEAVDAWLEKHPLNDFNGDQIDDLLDIDDYEPLSGYLSIYSFEVSGVSE